MSYVKYDKVEVVNGTHDRLFLSESELTECKNLIERSSERSFRIWEKPL